LSDEAVLHARRPGSGLVLILAVDHFPDMGRSTASAIGNSIAAAVVSKWEIGREVREGAAAHSVDRKFTE